MIITGAGKLDMPQMGMGMGMGSIGYGRLEKRKGG